MVFFSLSNSFPIFILCFHLPPHSHAKVNGRVYLIINRWVLRFFLSFKTNIPFFLLLLSCLKAKYVLAVQYCEVSRQIMFEYCSFLMLLKQLIHLFCIFIDFEFLLPAENSPKLCPRLNAGIIGAICNWLQTIDLVEEARLSTLCLCMERCMPACACVHTNTDTHKHRHTSCLSPSMSEWEFEGLLS